MLGIGATCGIVLSVASKVFYVYEDPRIAEVEYFWPGPTAADAGLPGAAPRPWPLSKVRPAPASASWPTGNGHANIAGVMGVDPGTAEPLKST
jgi:formate dehydrogenase beta subunit